LRTAVRERLPRPLAEAPSWGLPVAVYPAAALGLHQETAELLATWRNGHFGGRPGEAGRLDIPCLAFGLESAAQVRAELRRLGALLTTPEHVRGWLAHTELADLDLIAESVEACTARSEAHALLAVLARVRAPEVAPVMLRLKRSSKAPEVA